MPEPSDIPATPVGNPKSLAPQLYFGTLYLIGYVGFLWFIFGSGIMLTETQENIALIISGNLAIGMGMIMSFLYGSSAGSKAKDK